MGFANPAGPSKNVSTPSQTFATVVATRGSTFVQSHNPNIRIMCFITVETAEVLTCDVRVIAGQNMARLVGMFHFSGSSHCSVFRPQTDIIFRAGSSNLNALVTKTFRICNSISAAYVCENRKVTADD